jgi:hypothetical protein
VRVDVDGGVALAAGIALTGLSVPAVWIKYHQLGGMLSRVRLDAYIAGTEFWPDLEHDVATHAVNEALWESGIGSAVPYAREL